jgi:hypothetical protein
VEFKYVGAESENGEFAYATYARDSGGSPVSSGGFDVVDGEGEPFSVSFPTSGDFYVDVLGPGSVRALSKNIFVEPGVLVPAVPPLLPNPGIETRDPTAAGLFGTVPAAYWGGIDNSGVTPAKVYVTVNPINNADLGLVYDPPLDTYQVWSPSDLAAGSKQMISVSGSLTTYLRRS